MANECIRKIKVCNRLGLHVRPATQLVKTAERFKCDITLHRECFEPVNGKSIMSVLTLAAPKGTEITVKAKGEDAESAVDAIEALFKSGFGETE